MNELTMRLIAQRKRRKLNMKIKNALWIVAIIVCLFVIYEIVIITGKLGVGLWQELVKTFLHT